MMLLQAGGGAGSVVGEMLYSSGNAGGVGGSGVTVSITGSSVATLVVVAVVLFHGGTLVRRWWNWWRWCW
jgi:hypothetical protein